MDLPSAAALQYKVMPPFVGVGPSRFCSKPRCCRVDIKSADDVVDEKCWVTIFPTAANAWALGSFVVNIISMTIGIAGASCFAMKDRREEDAVREVTLL